MTTNPKVAICIPSGDMVHADFMLSVLEIAYRARLAGIKVPIVNARDSIIAQCRNRAVDAALATRADWLLFLDSDMTFDPNTVLRLLRHEKEIVGASGSPRRKSTTFVAERLDGTPVTLADTGLIEVSRIGGACLLIKADVFEKMQRPYFRFGIDEERQAIIGEDYLFCATVKSLGYQIWCDMDLSREVEHIGLQGFKVEEEV